ncbi:hypothetical protein [Haloflavibacter putidus]|uniref:Uncharacterized protein n=1 Tax=Haloflavibacter putidus TaxID=2576776 RepID=A0A507ZVN6_9FLAO|nr:hypothetical protein [Haloflavibacter putidus]TQD40661.1 hypothetical protein FKR84_01385 [Haloflavibacter putidus]
MKKSLENELMSIAHRILQLRNKADIHELKAVTGVLYEKLSVLSFTEKHFAGLQPTIGKKQIENALEDQQEQKIEKTESAEENKPKTSGENDIPNPRPDGTQHNTEPIIEPNTEKIKDIVEEMPVEENTKEETLEDILPEKEEKVKDDLRDLGVHYDELPSFERVDKKQETARDNSVKEEEVEQATENKNNDVSEEVAEDKLEEVKQESSRESPKPTPDETEKPKQENLFGSELPEFEPKKSATKNSLNETKRSLNDRLKNGINIGLNDRLAYIKHLFDGNVDDYNRVLSQLNTKDTFEEAYTFIEQQVKPDYNNWEGKEVYENRFMSTIENKF